MRRDARLLGVVLEELLRLVGKSQCHRHAPMLPLYGINLWWQSVACALAGQNGAMANRLVHATSPYLLQHRDNPVDWWEGGPDAMAEAELRNVPILISIGYSACHWCHVMAHESFEDEATATLMNELFVNVKVDREERPDVDAVYMDAVQAMTGSGGWPMTVFLAPDGRPFFGGTYFPRPSFTELLRQVATVWHDRRD